MFEKVIMDIKEIIESEFGFEVKNIKLLGQVTDKVIDYFCKTYL